MKRKKVKIPIYFGELDMYREADYEVLNKRFGFNMTKCYDAFVFRHVDKEGFVTYHAAFRGNYSPSVVAHEAVHIVNLIFQDCHVTLDPSNDEPQAYLTGWVVGEVHKFLKDESL